MKHRNKLKRAVRKYKRAVHGEINLETAYNYAERIGYQVIFYKKPDDERITRTGIDKQIKVEEITAFTHNGETVRAIFIDDKITYAEKLHSILHEIGHIALGHMGTLYLKNNDEIEAEAEAFVYGLLYYGR